MLLLGGYLLVHFFEHTITPHFITGRKLIPTNISLPPPHVGTFGLMIHAFFDGIAITAGFLISPWLGWIIFLAIFLHKIPEGFTVTSVMLASGLIKMRSWFASVMPGLATIAGVLTMAIGKHAVSYGLPVAAGVTIYVAASDLIPEVNREPGVKMALVVFIGSGRTFRFRSAGAFPLGRRQAGIIERRCGQGYECHEKSGPCGGENGAPKSGFSGFKLGRTIIAKLCEQG